MKKKETEEIENVGFFAQKPVFFGLLIFLLLGLSVFGFQSYQKSHQKVFDFESCKKAGNPILESYPAQCVGPDKKTYTEQISPANGSSVPYYGRSTNSPCNSGNECVENGCNKEICQGLNEEPIASICEYKENTPQRLGYSCKCVQHQCQWAK